MNINELENDLCKITKHIHEIKVERETSLKATRGRFNLFTTLLPGHDETRLHSRFITHLLNPNSDPNPNHDCRRLFLDLFLDIIFEGIQPHTESLVEQEKLETLKDLKQQKCLKVQTEHYTEHGNIDIYIEFKNHIIAIENKILAGEQPDQISRYIDFLNSKSKSKSHTMLYLTLDGKKSVTHKEKEYYRISYKEHILKWIDLCLKETYKYVNINQALQQYKSLIKELTGQSLEAEDMEELKSLLKKNPDIIKYMSDINRAFNEIYNDSINKYQEELKKSLKNETNEFFKIWVCKHNDIVFDLPDYKDELNGFKLHMDVEITPLKICLTFWARKNGDHNRDPKKLLEKILDSDFADFEFVGHWKYKKEYYPFDEKEFSESIKTACKFLEKVYGYAKSIDS